MQTKPDQRIAKLNPSAGELAAARGIEPTPEGIRMRLGAGSSSHEINRAALASLYAANKDRPIVKARRHLWARLLETALGTLFEDSDELFIEHALLAGSAEIIARAALGLEVESLVSASSPASAELDERGIHGAAGAGLFDWVPGLPGGDAFARDLARRLGRFDWSAVEHDVLKVLYESVIGPGTRKKLGEYYTPDWLAERIVEEVIADPLEARVLDPACGSGTFLFHAVRRYLKAAEASGMPVAAALDGVTSHVFGMDLHPVAVTLARATYLLAIGKDRLASGGRGSLRIPVYLVDSIQWPRRGPTLWSERELEESRADILVGNPPWLAYRHMPEAMQAEFREMSEARRLWRGAQVATHQDVSALFVVRAVEQHLGPKGRFGFVMPAAVLDRRQYAGFRSGSFDDVRAGVRIRFTRPWDLRRVRPHFFPVTAAVVFGSRAPEAGPMPSAAVVWSGRLPDGNASWADVAPSIERKLLEPEAAQREAWSPYRARFRQGATIVPRLLFMVERKEATPPDQAAGRASVRSVKSAGEKKPWKALPRLEGVVETEHIRPVHLGETILPYRTLPPRSAILPRDTAGLMDGAGERIERYPGLADWWRRAEACWSAHRSSERLTLLGRVNFHRGLESQFPIQPQRIVYTTSGMHLAAARVVDRRAVIDHKLYWASAPVLAEAHYLCAILNAAATTELVRPLMSYGKDERDIHKAIWRLPIPMFDPTDDGHAELASLGRRAEEEVAALQIDGERHFAASRRAIRQHLAVSGTGQRIEAIVEELLA